MRSDAQLRRAERHAEDAAASATILDGGGGLVATRTADGHVVKGLKAQVRDLQRGTYRLTQHGRLPHGRPARPQPLSAAPLPPLALQVRDLQRQLKDKEAAMAELFASSKSFRLKELQIQTRTYFGEARRLQALLDYSKHQKDGALAVLQQAHDEEMAAVQQQLQVLRSQSGALDDELGRCAFPLLCWPITQLDPHARGR